MKISNSVKWVTLSQAVKVFSQLFILLFLSRILTPDAYGLLAIISVISSFSLMLRDFGTSSSIVQNHNITSESLNSIYTFNILCGILVFILLNSTSYYIANFYNANILQYLILILSFSFPIASLSIVHQANLEKKLEFPLIAKIECFSILLSLLISSLLFFLGKSIYIIPCQSLLYAIFSSTLFFYFSKLNLKFSIKKFKKEDILGFSSNVAGFNFINYFARNADSIIIGKLLGTSILGFYSLSYRIMLFPVQNLTFIVNRTIFPYLSKYQNDKNAILSVYGNSISYISLLVAPIMFGIFYLRTSLVSLLFGSQWSMTPDILYWLAPVGLIQSLVSSTGAVFMATNNTSLLFRLGIFGAFIQIVSFIVGAQYNIFILCQLYLLSNILNLFICFYFISKVLNCSFLLLFNKFYKSIICSIVMTLSLQIFNIDSDINNVPMLILNIILGIIFYLFSSFILNKETLFNFIKNIRLK
ncbi:lipopolysaccharide biosynthesis protein [Providencia rettgeri]|uniref:lipopolysaccharide biosynthesis protein n=1 Tax=Providencia rettgeri TaxID=587 RepID=UPI001B36F6D5|nr:lipopolysaccharide biosynthesis protein [Providencia rettgeri]EMC8780759.1 lipopolysaccharide biosynthesis protein [Providencia rettgeri]MBQ0397788.1 lipopolysaccharide biosynthesis protein [Providencia rettgeri]